jgi:two-component system chemotaxis sensor kinase CheA
VQVVVFNDGNSSVGMVVDEILDVTEDAVTVRQGSERKGLLGSAVVGKQVTDFLDLNEVIRAAGGNWFASRNGHAGGQTILLADASAFSRAMVRGGLDMAAYVVLEAANLEQAIAQLEQHAVNLVLAALELPPGGSSALLAAVRLRAEWDKIPVVVLAGSAEQAQTAAARAAGFEDCQPKYDRLLVLESVARLVSPATSFAAAPLLVGAER